MDAILIEGIEKDPELMKLYLQEKLIMEVTEAICKLMTMKEVNKTTLAELLGMGKSNVTQLLNGNTNMTLRTISDMLWALDSKLVINAIPVAISERFIGVLETFESLISQAANYKPEKTDLVGRPHQQVDSRQSLESDIRMVA